MFCFLYAEWCLWGGVLEFVGWSVDQQVDWEEGERWGGDCGGRCLYVYLCLCRRMLPKSFA